MYVFQHTSPQQFGWIRPLAARYSTSLEDPHASLGSTRMGHYGRYFCQSGARNLGCRTHLPWLPAHEVDSSLLDPSP